MWKTSKPVFSCQRNDLIHFGLGHMCQLVYIQGWAPWSQTLKNPNWQPVHTLQTPSDTTELILRLAEYLVFQEPSVWEMAEFSILRQQLLPLSSKPQALSVLMNDGHYGPWAGLAEAQRRWNMCSGWGSSISFIVLRSVSHTIALNLVSEIDGNIRGWTGFVLLLLLPGLILSHFSKQNSEDCDCWRYTLVV